MLTSLEMFDGVKVIKCTSCLHFTELDDLGIRPLYISPGPNFRQYPCWKWAKAIRSGVENVILELFKY